MRKNNSTKKALLSSVFSLMLCFVMLIGTTFAWFTDNASTSVNTIQAGNLDVELLDASGNSLEGETLKWQKASGHENDAVLWEPGCTYELQPITIKNSGNLALKYKVEITGINGDAELNNAIEWTISEQALTVNRFLKAGTAETLTISGHMKEEADNTYQGMSIDGIAIKVYATQAPEEYDSTRNDYDAAAEYNTTTSSTSPIVNVATVEELKSALTPTVSNDTATVNLTADIALGAGETWTPLDMNSYTGVKKIVINGNGHSISNLSDSLFGYCYFGNVTVEINDLTLKDATITQNTSNSLGYGAFIAATDNCASLVLDNCHLKNYVMNGIDDMGALVGYSSSSVFKLKDCSAEGCTLTGADSVGGLVGTCGYGTISFDTCKAENMELKSTKAGTWRTGYAIGTVPGAGTVTLENVTYSGGSLTQSASTGLNEGATRTYLVGRSFGNVTGDNSGSY